MTTDKLAQFSRIADLCGLPRPLLRKLAELSGIQRIGKGSHLFCAGERCHYIYALAEGCVSLVCDQERGEIVAEFVGPNDFILLPPALLDLPYMVGAKAVTDLLVMMIPAGDFRRLVQSELPLSIAVNRILARHWRLLMRHLTQTKSRDADSRVVRYLLDSAGSSAGAAFLALPCTKQDLAAHLGMTPATLSRAFKRLGQWGVKTSGTQIEIENVPKLGAHLQAARPGNLQPSAP
ncbi:MAG TPA: Crp/Fnr family transcriptional regulator [Rhizomicrobium sp.]|nr:Crp/Fnr family transcriptional regulator [Rhizomicrobium sp.]